MVTFMFQAYCTGHAGRNEPSFGRRKREVNETEVEYQNEANVNSTEEEPEHVREMIEVSYILSFILHEQYHCFVCGEYMTNLTLIHLSSIFVPETPEW